MYICSCKGITDQQIKEAQKGRKASCARDLCSVLGLGSDCGSCLEAAMDVLQENDARQTHHQALVKKD